MKIDGPHSTGVGSNGSFARDDAEWSALRYVLGEMSGEEVEAYERMLATDSQACERVASATRLATDLYSVLAHEIESNRATPAISGLPAIPGLRIPTRARPTQSGLWAVVGLVAAVCLLAAAGLSLLSISGDHQDAITSDDADASAGSLVAIWTERSADTATDPSTVGLAGANRTNADGAPSFSAADDAESDSVADSVLIADDDYDVPAWMIAAVESGTSWRPDNSDVEFLEN
jgi:anti-sigma factor RsiW